MIVICDKPKGFGEAKTVDDGRRVSKMIFIRNKPRGFVDERSPRQVFASAGGMLDRTKLS